jgi:hypothetical protein
MCDHGNHSENPERIYRAQERSVNYDIQNNYSNIRQIGDYSNA